MRADTIFVIIILGYFIVREACYLYLRNKGMTSEKKYVLSKYLAASKTVFPKWPELDTDLTPRKKFFEDLEDISWWLETKNADPRAALAIISYLLDYFPMQYFHMNVWALIAEAKSLDCLDENYWPYNDKFPDPTLILREFSYYEKRRIIA